MTIEATLERIATALEAIARNAGPLGRIEQPGPAPEPEAKPTTDEKPDDVPASNKPAGKPGRPRRQPVADPVDHGVAAPPAGDGGAAVDAPRSHAGDSPAPDSTPAPGNTAPAPWDDPAPATPEVTFSDVQVAFRKFALAKGRPAVDQLFAELGGIKVLTDLPAPRWAEAIERCAL